MEIKFLTAKDLQEKLGYKSSKAYQIIKELNATMQMEAKKQGKKILIFPGRIREDYFKSQTGGEVIK